MRYILFTAFFITLSYAQEKPRLQEEEIKRVGKFDFQNRNRNRADRATRSVQENIGRRLANSVTASPEESHSFKGVSAKRYPANDSKLFGADILSISDEASYGHINSIFRIVSGYVQDAFDFNEESADTIALYVLYYNGMYRKDKSYFESKYTENATMAMNSKKVGIAKNFKEWAGNTQIVIPLELSSIREPGQEIILDELETEVSKVIEEKKNGPELAKKIEEVITERKKEDEELIKIKEEKKPETPDSPKTVTPETKTDEKVPEKEVPIVKPETPTKKEELAAVKDSKPVEKPKEVEKAKEVTKEKTTEKIEKKETPVEKAKKQDSVEVKELKKEVNELKAREKEKEQKSDNVIGEKILFLRLIAYEDDGHYTNELWMLDAVNIDSIYKSPYTNICGKEFHVVQGGVVVIGFDGKRPKERVHRLVYLDEEKLAQKYVSKQEIFWRSQLIYRDNKIYAFEKFNDKVYFSRFNLDMSLDSRSSEPVNTNSEVSFFKDKIFLTGKQSEQEETVIRVMQRDDLKVIKTIKPVERKK
ncbi:MAG: P83/100 family protein [Leptospiraceae bacterium]|nr:P83/100 family protein [Leptospiraceae bacterium]